MPNAQIANAETMGIQQFVQPIFADCAIRKVGMAMSATTAGRIPRNMAAMIVFSLNAAKKMAIAKIIRNDGSAVPKAVATAPFNLRSL